MDEGQKAVLAASAHGIGAAANGAANIVVAFAGILIDKGLLSREEAVDAFHRLEEGLERIRPQDARERGELVMTQALARRIRESLMSRASMH